MTRFSRVFQISKKIELFDFCISVLSKLKMKVEESTQIICTAHSEGFPELRKSVPLERGDNGRPRLQMAH